VVCQWVDCDRYTVSRRYDRLATYIPLFDRILFLPKDSRRKAVDRLGLRAGDRVLDVGCGTGRSLGYLHKAVGPTGRVYGIDISAGMLRKAQKSCDANGWDNVELMQCDAAAFTAPMPLDGVLFSLSYNTMPDHRAVLRRAWDQLVPGGRLVIMDAKVPPRSGRQTRVAVQSLVDEAHDARQSADPSVGGARLADRALGYEPAALQFLLCLLRNQTRRSDEPRRGDRHERRRLSDCGGINVLDCPRIIGFAKTRTPTDAVS
jgi:ubiquinone/menaquinone biosynthesis C-methylase UbiE